MSQDDKVDCIFCHGTGKLAFSEETRKLAQRAVEAQRNDTRTMDEKIRDGVSFILGPDAPDDPAQEGYPGIAHDFETMRSALVQIRDECFNGHAHDIAEAALNAAPQAAETQLKGTAVNLPELRDRLDSSGLSGAAEHRDGAETPKKGLIADQADVSRPAVAAPNSATSPTNSEMQAVWDMLLLDGNCSKPDLQGAAKLRQLLDDLITARSAGPHCVVTDAQCDRGCDGALKCARLARSEGRDA